MNEQTYQVNDRVLYNGQFATVIAIREFLGTEDLTLQFEDGSIREDVMTSMVRPNPFSSREEQREHNEQRARDLAEVVGMGEDDGITPEVAKRANEQPRTYTKVEKVFDTELGWVDECVTVHEPAQGDEIKPDHIPGEEHLD